MDTTETYIKMSLKAEKHLGVKESKNPSSIMLCDNGVMLDSHGDYYAETQGNNLIHQFYRQDQLQAMMPPDKPSNRIKVLLASKFAHFIAMLDDALSMEQLWLAFVMHEKYGEMWDSDKEDWVKTNLLLVQRQIEESP